MLEPRSTELLQNGNFSIPPTRYLKDAWKPPVKMLLWNRSLSYDQLRIFEVALLWVGVLSLSRSEVVYDYWAPCLYCNECASWPTCRIWKRVSCCHKLTDLRTKCLALHSTKCMDECRIRAILECVSSHDATLEKRPHRLALNKSRQPEHSVLFQWVSLNSRTVSPCPSIPRRQIRSKTWSPRVHEDGSRKPRRLFQRQIDASASTPWSAHSNPKHPIAALQQNSPFLNESHLSNSALEKSIYHVVAYFAQALKASFRCLHQHKHHPSFPRKSQPPQPPTFLQQHRDIEHHNFPFRSCWTQKVSHFNRVK